ncbi:MAG: diaminopimelate dehydrogenase [Defluviitaleaceae bacterium]|nr:diaminopimelate dehydrogenase [Defluviitaleaceae bacterium]
MYRIAVVGYGNVGKQAVEAVTREPDMILAGVVRRKGKTDLPPELRDITVTDDITTLGKVDAALLAVPTRNVPEYAKKYLALGISTVDSYDIHDSIAELRSELDPIAKAGGAAAVIAAGWDPGSDSVIRAMLEACAPRGITYTNFGPGMSMGHSVAAKAIPGVLDALSITMPMGAGIHRRMLYVTLEPGASLEDVTALVKQDSYFSGSETIVTSVSDLNAIRDMGHGVSINRKGMSGAVHNQLFEFNMKINGPALTAQIMICSARAALRQKPGAYTLIETPLIDLLPGDRDEIIRRLV